MVEETSDKSKLKGVLWPGMSLFDSATEDQKRKRNQRKDVGVLRRMERVAAGVEPTEGIYSEDFDLQRTRDIYATPSVFGSPVCPSVLGRIAYRMMLSNAVIIRNPKSSNQRRSVLAGLRLQSRQAQDVRSVRRQRRSGRRRRSSRSR